MTSKWESDDEVDEDHWKLVLENILTLQSKEQHKDTIRTFETMKVMLKQKYPAKVLNKVMKQIRGMAETTHFRAFVCAVQGMYSLVAVGSSGILKGKQKLGVTFNSDKQDVIDFKKFSKLKMCRASEANS